MDKLFCLICKKPRNTDRRAKYCCNKHSWRAWWQRAAAASVQTQALPLASLPSEADEILPLGAPERLLIAIQLALIGKALAGAHGARGYRVGTYAVAYMNQHGEPTGGPRFSIAIDQADARLNHSDGDRTYKPCPRG